MKIFIAIILTMVSSQVLYAYEVKWQVSRPNNGAVDILGGGQGQDSLKEAITSVAKDVRINQIRLFLSSENDLMQTEIHAYLAQHYPEQLKAALASAGNMHNPKVVALRNAFRESVFASKYIAEINAKLKARCEQVTEVSFEKFHIKTKQAAPKYSAMLWLTVATCSDEPG